MAQLAPNLNWCAPLVREMSSRSEEHTSELQSQSNLVCRLLLEKKKKRKLVLNQQEFHLLVSTLHHRRVGATTQDCLPILTPLDPPLLRILSRSLSAPVELSRL